MKLLVFSFYDFLNILSGNQLMIRILKYFLTFFSCVSYFDRDSRFVIFTMLYISSFDSFHVLY